MEKLAIDLIGELRLLIKEEGGRSKPLFDGYKGHGNIQGISMQHSCIIYLLEEDKLLLGESCEAELRFLFRDEAGFSIQLVVGQIFELNEGARKVGEFRIHKIVNENILQ